ncbi:MAG TPA: cytochrome c-type biogenesis protein CcmH [Caldilineaceae bacterium]|nr:cytochrome c-type biogenesis protein CcmH [Caldilineaceae bacterium]
MNVKQLVIRMVMSAVAAVLLLQFASVTPLAAQEGDAQAVTDSQTDASNITPDQVNEIARELWCPLCSGVRLDSCELKACEQMKEVIAIKLADGEDLDAIRTYFVAQYGPQVLGEPPREGFNWLAWVIPFIVLAIGGYVLWTTIKRITRPAPAPVATVPNAPSPGAGEGAAGTDEYQAKLAEELKRYG